MLADCPRRVFNRWLTALTPGAALAPLAAPADGDTLLSVSFAHAVAPAIYAWLPFDAAHIGNLEQADFFNRRVAAFLGV